MENVNNACGRKGYIKTALKVIAFVLVLGIALAVISDPLINPGEARCYQNVAGFYTLRENSLDAVYIGSSRVYAFWTPLFGWNEYGISVYNFASAGAPLETVRYSIEEVRKTQPNALMIVNLDEVKKPNAERTHQVLDYMKLSKTKLAAISRMAEKLGSDFTERLSFVFPLIQYHSRWSELTDYDFTKELDSMFGSSSYSGFLWIMENYADKYVVRTEDTVPEIDAESKAVLDELLDYCDKESVNVLFVISPQMAVSAEKLDKRAAAAAYVKSRGYPVLDFQSDVDKIGLDLTQDYYNEEHTNIHGSYKYTRYLADYLVKNYGFADKRNDAAYDDWNAAAKKYEGYIGPYYTDIEAAPYRDYSLAAPQGLTVTVAGEDAVLSWEPVEGADGYAVYRKKTSDIPFKLVDTTTETGFTLAGASNKGTWTVIPYTEKDGVRYYGNFDYTGKAA